MLGKEFTLFVNVFLCTLLLVGFGLNSALLGRVPGGRSLQVLLGHGLAAALRARFLRKYWHYVLLIRRLINYIIVRIPPFFKFL